MKLISTLTFILLQIAYLGAQDVTELYFDTYDSRKISHIVVENSCGTIYVEPSDIEMGAKVEFSYDDEVSIQAAKLKGNISIEKSVRGDTIFLSTIFDEAIFARKNLLWEIKDNINIEYRIIVPRKADLHITQKYGKVIIGRNAIPIFVNLDNSKLYAELSENLTVVGKNFFIDASDVKELSVSGRGGELILGNTGLGYLDLTDSNVESMGFESLRGNLDNSSMSCGSTWSCQVTANNSTLEFSDLTNKAICEITETRLVVQKMPLTFQVRSTGGSSTFSLAKDRDCQLNLYSKENNTELYLKGGNLRMDYNRKKTTLDLPAEAVFTKERAVLAQRDDHGITVTAELERGEFTVKK